MQVQLLGPLWVGTEHGGLTIGSTRQRQLLCLLALRASRTVRADDLILGLWGDEPPLTAAKTLQTHVAALRRVLPDGVLRTVPGGYVLGLEPSDVDATRFEGLARTARRLDTDGNLTDAHEALEAALALWRGQALVDLADSPFARSEAARLEELRRATEEHLADVRLRLGGHEAAVSDLEAAVASEPLREHRWAQLMIALYRSGRQAEALRAYQRLRSRLGEDLGIEPSAELSALEGSILRHAPELDWAGSAASDVPPPDTELPRARPTGTVTFLFTDVEGSTRLWEDHPGPMALALGRHNEIVRAAIESVGGFVFTTAGEAFRAAFSSAGIAVEVARAIQEALCSGSWPEPVELKVRMALHSGTCEERDGDYSGPVLSRTARLVALAHGGQVLLSNATAELVNDVLAEGTALRDLGEHRLKDLGRPERVFQLEIEGVPAQFPPLRSLGTGELPNNLPEQVSSFIGREREIGELRDLVERSRLVTLAGAGGSGKTRLALQVGVELLDGWGDGVWFVELAALTLPEQVEIAVASVFGIQPRAGRSLIDTLLGVFFDQRFLLILDNCEHVVSAAAEVSEAVLRRCPRVHIVATSREPLGADGESVYLVPTLSVLPDDTENIAEIAACDAVRLFLDRASNQQPSFVLDHHNAAVVASLCRRLDGIPLALELAAARLRSLTLEELHDHLEDRFHLLTGGNRGSLPRHQTLEALIDWSYQLLNPPERALLRKLSVFSGGFDLKSAEKVCRATGSDPFDVVDLVGSLVDKSLILADTVSSAVTRYRMLETIRQFASAKVQSEDGVTSYGALRDAHAEVYLALSDEAAAHLASHEQVVWLNRLDAELDNILSATAHLAARPAQATKAMQLLVNLDRFWLNAHHIAEALQACEPLAGTPAPANENFLFARFLITYGRLLAHHDPDRAYELLEQAIAIAQVHGQRVLLAQALRRLAILAYLRGAEPAWQNLHEEAIAVARTAGDQGCLADALSYPCLNRDEIHEALALYGSLGDRFNQALYLGSLADFDLVAGDPAAAVQHSEAAMALQEEIGRGYSATTLGNLATARVLQSEFGAARPLYIRALRVARREFAPLELGYAFLGVALCDSAAGSNDQAACLHGVADALFEQLGFKIEAVERGLATEDHSHLRNAMGDQAFAEAYGAGWAMSKDDALTLALVGS